VVHLVNGLLDARKEGAPVIAIAGDTESSILDSGTVEELNPYIFFAAAGVDLPPPCWVDAAGGVCKPVGTMSGPAAELLPLA
jgi:hypothetical protein